jgi:imidazole glycerol-phosphate synthase subunit HisH
MVVIIDYGMGNLGSVKRKLDLIGVSALITSNQEEISRSERIILPGVGHFGKAIKEIRRRGLYEILNEQVLEEKKPVLGICLGMQLMAAHSEEGDSEGFGWFDADVVRLKIKDSIRFKIPHMGWNMLESKKESQLLKDLPADGQYYFVHSYHFQCNDSADVLATTFYETEFVSAVQKGNIYGTQFHPEKSHEAGERMLVNFLGIGNRE